MKSIKLTRLENTPENIDLVQKIFESAPEYFVLELLNPLPGINMGKSHEEKNSTKLR